MSQLWCLDCQTVFDARQGHTCVHNRCMLEASNRYIYNFQTLREEVIDMSQLTSFVIEEQSYHPTADINRLGNRNPDFSMHTSLTERETNNNDQTNNSSRTFASEVSLMSNVGNKYHDSLLALGSIDSLIPDKMGTDTPCKEHQKQIEVQNDQLLLNNNQAHRLHGYEISCVSNEIPYISNEESRRNGEFEIQGSLSDEKMSVKAIQQPEMKRHFSKCGQIAEGMLRKANLGNMIHVLATKKTQQNKRLKPSNRHAVNITDDSATYTGSHNTKVRCKKINVEKIQHGCTTTTSENKLPFNDNVHVLGQEKSAAKGFSNPETSKSVQACSVDDAPAVAGPSGSQDCDRTCPLCQKVFSSKCSMNRHYKEHSDERPFTCETCQKVFKQKSILKMHMLIHIGEKPHKCVICSKGFTQKAHLKCHIRSVHKLTS